MKFLDPIIIIVVVIIIVYYADAAHKIVKVYKITQYNTE